MTPVLSPEVARAVVWVGFGAVARSRRNGWRPRAAGVEKTYFEVFELNQAKDPNDDNDVDDVSVLNNKG